MCFEVARRGTRGVGKNVGICFGAAMGVDVDADADGCAGVEGEVSRVSASAERRVSAEGGAATAAALV